MNVSVALVVVLLVACIATASAGRRSNNKNKNRACRYDRGNWSECDTATNTRILTKNLVGTTKGCELTKTKTKPCPTKCKYIKSGTWSECDASNKRHMTQTLNSIKSGTNCPETMVKTKNCRPNSRTAKGCKYSKTTWSECVNGTRTGTKALIKGGASCQQAMTKTAKCQ